MDLRKEKQRILDAFVQKKKYLRAFDNAIDTKTYAVAIVHGISYMPVLTKPKISPVSCAKDGPFVHRIYEENAPKNVPTLSMSDH